MKKKRFYNHWTNWRAGCGCSTVSELLSIETFEDLPLKKESDSDNDYRVNKIVYDFAKGGCTLWQNY